MSADDDETWSSRQQRESAEMLADQETLRQVTDDLVEARILLRMVVQGMSPTTERNVRGRRTPWVRVNTHAVANALAYVERQ